jgi:hypothetical protein
MDQSIQHFCSRFDNFLLLLYFSDREKQTVLKLAEGKQQSIYFSLKELKMVNFSLTSDGGNPNGATPEAH